jgi:short subunit dehydrogenase-like uncharacterized protein
MSRTWIIYGAYGQAGSAVVERAVELGLEPLLAGVDEMQLSAQAAYYGLDSRSCSVDQPEELDRLFANATVVLNCAGPFVHTAGQLAESCIRTGTHYLDLTGEPQVFELLAGYDEQARAAGVMLLPGVGLDIVPSDYLAHHLKTRLPTASRLVLGFRGIQRATYGALTTLLDSVASYRPAALPGANGATPRLLQSGTIDFGDGPERAISVPWGDLVSARYSVGIENVQVYLVLPLSARIYLKAARHISLLARQRTVRALFADNGSGRGWADDSDRASRSGRAGGSDREVRPVGAGRPFGASRQEPSGGADREAPDEERQSLSRCTTIYGEVSNGYGSTARALFRGPDTHTLLATTAVTAVQRVLDGEWVSGFHTPTRVYGCGLVEAIPDIEFEDLD